MDLAALAGRIRPLLGTLETERRLPAAVVEAMVAAGVFKLCIPKSLGGSEAGPRAMVDAIEALARVDGSVGWCLMIGLTSSLTSVYLEPAVAREIFAPADAIACGVFAPMGRAAPVDGGYRVTGRWPFASGCQHSQWRMGGTIVTSDPPVLLPSGAPDVRCVMFAAGETMVHDTWDTAGLRGTGSHDISVTDVVVPHARTFSLFSDRPRHPGYALPFFGVLAAGVAAVGLGIAHAAIETASELVRSKTPPGSKRSLAHREHVQLEIARADARIRGARAALHETLAAAVEATSVDLTAPPTLLARARLRIAACHAAAEGAAVAAAMYELGGGGAIYAASPLQRQFRDASVVTHHVMVGSTALAMAGRTLLGVGTDSELL